MGFNLVLLVKFINLVKWSCPHLTICMVIIMNEIDRSRGGLIMFT